MADYKELLRRAIEALPENNGSARRAVYEKARSALVNQLRAIQPPLPAREITQHRLQLEDCIRQVEQEASEAVISLGRDGFGTGGDSASMRSAWSYRSTDAPAPQPAPADPEDAPLEQESAEEAPLDQEEDAFPSAVAEPEAAEESPEAAVEEPQPEVLPPPPVVAGTAKLSIEDIIARAAQNSGAEVAEIDPAEPAVQQEVTPQPAPITPIPAQTLSNVRPFEPVQRPPAADIRRETGPAFGTMRATVEPVRVGARIEPVVAHQSAVARQVATPLAVTEAPVDPALSSVREVDVEAAPDETREAEGAIQRAIQTLDREARGEPTEPLPERDRDDFAMVPPAKDPGDTTFAAEASPGRSGPGLTIFLIVFAVLLIGVGGAGFWAWREGYVDLDQMFGQAPAVQQVAETPAPVAPPPTLDVPEQSGTEVTGPGNTTPITAPGPTSDVGGLEIEDRLEPTPEAVTPQGTESVLPPIGANGEIKSEERLPQADEALPGTDSMAASVDPAVLAGSQSLLLEANTDGQPGAVPFSGTVDWARGEDELGLPTLTGSASIPARNLSVDITIRKNSDPALPASHLMEIDFNVSDSFVGGSIANVAGVLLKDQELVTGTPLVGASARVVGNSFLFALSAAEADLAQNTDLLENRRWMDLAIVYGTGRNAIITLEKDEEALGLFDEVFTAWAE